MLGVAFNTQVIHDAKSGAPRDVLNVCAHFRLHIVHRYVVFSKCKHLGCLEASHAAADNDDVLTCEINVAVYDLLGKIDVIVVNAGYALRTYVTASGSNNYDIWIEFGDNGGVASISVEPDVDAGFF